MEHIEWKRARQRLLDLAEQADDLARALATSGYPTDALRFEVRGHTYRRAAEELEKLVEQRGGLPSEETS